MHDDLKSFRQKPVLKIAQKLQNFEKPKSLSKIPKVRSKDMKCMINEWESIIPEKNNDLEVEDHLGKRFGVRERCLGRWEVWRDQERSRRNKRNVAQTLFIEILVSRWIERCRELKSEK